ncbi:hypothetical protein HanPSC8_Chr06g0242871 [Helianthus annuus]|nr:hypothetical protein HanPSC8_Chr06g0242871 [Helianthus annuus]
MPSFYLFNTTFNVPLLFTAMTVGLCWPINHFLYSIFKYFANMFRVVLDGSNLFVSSSKLFLEIVFN